MLKGDFEIRRKQNDKKLRYLLHKEKKINHFFVNVTLKGKKPCPTSRADSRLAWTHKVVKNGDIRDDYSRKYQSSRTNRGYKMRLGREEEDMLVFEK